MKFALVNNIKKEAKPKEIGSCICCGSSVRAYCGKERINHWKHIELVNCDSWYEGETEWHRKWKNEFTLASQEYIFRDPETNEKHIADIYNSHLKLVIEFQNSPITLDEIASRETFYKKMIWIVNVASCINNITVHKKMNEPFYNKVIMPHCRDWDNRRGKVVGGVGSDEDNELLKELKQTDAYFEYIEKTYYPNEDTSDYYFMEWNFQHKRWNFTNMPTFFDLGDDYIYLRVEVNLVWNGFIVKRFTKKRFIEHYNNYVRPLK